jgi:O-antigen/teichoic acid export membrane protein
LTVPPERLFKEYRHSLTTERPRPELPPEPGGEAATNPRGIWREALGRLGSGGQKGLARGAVIAFVLQGLGAALTFAMQVLLGRWMGVSDYGTYSFTLAWAALVAVLAGVGLPITVLRFIPAFLSHGDYGRIRGILNASVLITGAVSCGIALVGSAVVILVGGGSPDWVVIAGLWIAAGLTMRTLFQEIVRGFRQMALAYAPGMVLRPLFIILGGAAFVVIDGNLDTVAALEVTIAAIAISLLMQGASFWWKVRSVVRRAAPVYETRAWMMVALPLLLIVGFELVLSETDIVMVGAFLGSKSAGVYTAASKTSILLTMIVVSVNAIAAPMYSSLWAQGKVDELAELARRVTVWVFWPTIAASIFLAVLAKPILDLFGAEFSGASWVLIVLLIGQIVSAATGSVGYLMTLTGHQREAAHVYGGVAVLHLAVSAVAIPLLGTIGAAAAISFSVSVWNLWLHRLVVRRLGIHPSIFARPRLGGGHA